jgi:hypothetical protein
MDGQFFLGSEPAPVRQSGGVAEQHAQRESPRPLVALQVSIIGQLAQTPPEIAFDRLVEIEGAFFDELHDDRGEHRLRQGCARHDTLLRQRGASFPVLKAVRLQVDDFAVAPHRQPEPGDLRGLHQTRDVGVELRGGERAVIQPENDRSIGDSCAPRAGESQCQQHESYGWIQGKAAAEVHRWKTTRPRPAKLRFPQGTATIPGTRRRSGESS